MSIFWILAIIAVVLIIFSGIFGFRGAARTGWGILFSYNGYSGHYQVRKYF